MFSIVCEVLAIPLARHFLGPIKVSQRQNLDAQKKEQKRVETDEKRKPTQKNRLQLCK